MYYELLLDNKWLPTSYKNSKRTCIQLKFFVYNDLEMFYFSMNKYCILKNKFPQLQQK